MEGGRPPSNPPLSSARMEGGRPPSNPPLSSARMEGGRPPSNPPLSVSPRPQADGAALERPPLVLAHAAPHAGVLTGVNGPAQAILDRRAASANLLCFFNLEERRPSVPDREEQLRIYLTTGGNVAPVHDVHSFSASRLVIGAGRHAPLGCL